MEKEQIRKIVFECIREYEKMKTYNKEYYANHKKEIQERRTKKLKNQGIEPRVKKTESEKLRAKKEMLKKYKEKHKFKPRKVKIITNPDPFRVNFD